VVESLPNMHKALGLITTTKKKNNIEFTWSGVLSRCTAEMWEITVFSF
jgi:hypothetical protein